MIKLIGQILNSALKNLFLNQPDIFNFTSQTGQTEWNLTHHLANEIHKYLFWLDHDLDVTKRNLENKRPDIIFHKRGINELNFLVVEVKNNRPIEEDIKKIKNDWMGSELNYRFGACIKIKNEQEQQFIVFNRNGKKLCNKKELQYLPIKEIPQSLKEKIDKLVNKIASLSQSEKGVRSIKSIETLTNEIDKIILSLF